MKKLLISSIVAAVLVLSFANVNTFAQSSKAAIGNTGLSVISDNSVSGTTSTADADGFDTIMMANIRTANDKGFAFDVALQTGIYTDTEVKSKGGAKASAQASGRVLVRIKVTDPDGNIGFAQPSADIIKSADPNAPDPVILANSGVTYDYRKQLLEASFQGICIDEVTYTDPDTGEVITMLQLRNSIDECDFETVRFMLDTLQAHAFNFYYGLTDSGVYNVQVQAKLETSASGTDGDWAQGVASARAVVGLGSMFVENVRLVKGSGWDVPSIELK